MRQLTLAVTGFERYGKTTRRAVFLAEMERVVPWPALCALIAPVYPKAGNGRPPVGLERMLRLYFLQHWLDLSDPAVEEALYDLQAMRAFAGIDLGLEPVPDETTVCRFRHLLEAHDLGRRLFDEVQLHLAAEGLKVATGTIVDATIIQAPSSTRNAAKARDPEMHQTKKGNQWHFGMKAHLGVDSRSKLIHAVVATAANVADSTVLPELLHGKETKVWGDQAYRGQRTVIRDTPRGPRISSIADTVTAASWTRRSGRGTAPSRRCAPRSSIRSASSSASSASPRCAIAGSRRMLIASSSPAPSPTCSSPAGICCAASRRSAPAAGQRTAPPAQHGANRRHHPTPSPGQDVSVLLIQATNPCAEVP